MAIEDMDLLGEEIGADLSGIMEQQELEQDNSARTLFYRLDAPVEARVPLVPENLELLQQHLHAEARQ